MAVVTLHVDGMAVAVPAGAPLLQALSAAGVTLPTLCHHPRLSPVAACRLCLVELEGAPRPVPACVTAAAEGQRLATDTPALRQGRRLIVELLFAEGNHPCAVCVADGDCEAETIGCPACGPRLQLQSAAGAPLARGDGASLAAACRLLRQGGILALQGVGGFQLLVLAADGRAVARLRRRKRRPHRPFALLVDDPARLTAAVAFPPGALAALGDPAAPIVLLPRRTDPGAGVAAAVAPGSPWLGVMLPPSPLQLLLAQGCGAPLIATSGNPSGEPLCIDPAEARRRLAAVADGFLIHDRSIARPLDDSLLQLVAGSPVLLRRARGFAPAPLRLPLAPAPGQALLALGGDFKAAPALMLQGTVWPAPHRGDLASAAVERSLAEGLDRVLHRWAPQLEGLVCDSHPGAISGRLAADLADCHHLPLRRVPHHHAHAWAVAAEHGCRGPLLAWAADGLGHGDGDDHCLRGCELLLLQSGQPVRRLACLRPFPLPGGDRAALEPRRCALGLLHTAGLLDHPAARPCRDAFTAAATALLLTALDRQLQAPPASSLGRLLDGLAAVMGLLQRQTHEGQAALLLEALAGQSGNGSGDPATDPLPLAMPLRPAGAGRPPRLDWQPLLQRLLDLRQPQGVSAARQALSIHRSVALSLVRVARRAAVRHGCRQVALGGGCFQNALLLAGCRRGLTDLGLEPLWSQQMPANDGGLALGQLWAALNAP